MNITSSVSTSRIAPPPMPREAGEISDLSAKTTREALNVSFSRFAEVDAITEDLDLNDPKLDSLFDEAFSLPPPPMPAELGGGK